MRHAFVAARNRPGGINLGLRFAEIWWQGYGGMSLLEVTKKLSTLKAFGEEPDVIIIHCGGNDIGRVPLYKLRLCIDNILAYINKEFRVSVVWSEILPRTAWRYSVNALAMEATRRRLNSYAANKFVTCSGLYIKHPDLKDASGAFYLADGVHLSLLGNCMFLNQLSAALEAFRAGDIGCFE